MPRRVRKQPAQLTLDHARRPVGHGGWRPGAGRPRGRTRCAHVARAEFPRRHPQHVTLRVRAGVASLRRFRPLRAIKQAIARAQRGERFAVVHFAVLATHVHLIVEAEGATALARGMQGLAVRIARGVNRALDRRGELFAERYHARALTTPRQTRNALRYVMCNARHHTPSGVRLSRCWIDPCSSAAWFDGWREPIRAREPWLRELLAEAPPTAPPSVWLLTTGWKRRGLLGFDEAPGAR